MGSNPTLTAIFFCLVIIMSDSPFVSTRLSHIPAVRRSGDSAYTALTPDNFLAAIEEITCWAGYAPTPLHSLDSLASRIGVRAIYYKDEASRFGLGSFKALGGAYAALRLLGRELSASSGSPVSLSAIRSGSLFSDCSAYTLTSATDGNHGRSLAWGCSRYGAGCRIYIHAGVSASRASAMSDLGAEVVRIDGDYDDSVRACRSESELHGWHIVSDTSWSGYESVPCDVMSGYGVMTREICDVLPSPPTHVFLQGGVGGLAASVASYLRQHYGASSPRVIIVEPELAACLHASASAGTLTSVDIKEETLMAGLSCGEPSPLAWRILSEEASDFLTIPEHLVGPCLRLLLHPLGSDPSILAGESAVAGLCGLVSSCSDSALRSSLCLDADSSILLIGSEGITDPDIFSTLTTED